MLQKKDAVASKIVATAIIFEEYYIIGIIIWTWIDFTHVFSLLVCLKKKWTKEQTKSTCRVPIIKKKNNQSS